SATASHPFFSADYVAKIVALARDGDAAKQPASSANRFTLKMPERQRPIITTGHAAFGGPSGGAISIPGDAVDEQGRPVLRCGVPLNPQTACYDSVATDFVLVKGQYFNR
ncbi:unnamed protein product, partial [Amoebophrya sp. A25]